MRMQEFIFSDLPHHRLRRHFAFLSILGITFFFQSIVPGTSIYQTAFFSLCCFFPTCIFSIYACLYYLLPSFLQKKKNLNFLFGFTLLAAACLMINHQAAGIFLNLATDFGKPGSTASEQMNLSFINTSHALIIGGLALGIKFAENLYWQQKENSMLTRQKIITDLRLEKTRIYPRLLYQSLDNMRSGISSGSTDASAQLLKVSELLSYILYDNDEKWVPLEKELSMMQHLIDIGRTGRAKNLDIHVQITGNPGKQYIVPMTLFPLLENCFKLLEEQKTGKPTVELDIKIQTGELIMNLGIHHTAGISEEFRHWQQLFNTTSKRLDALYPEGCRLDIKTEQQKITVLLKVILKNHIVNFLNEEIDPVYEIQ